MPAAIPVSRPRHTNGNRPKITRATWIKIGVGSVIGLVAALLTGWVVLVAMVPAAIVGVPYLLGSGSDVAGIKQLDALEEWTRSLSGVLGAGVSLEQAIVVSQASAPAAIEQQINNLAARLRSRMSSEEALRRFADELEDTTADKIVATLILGARRRNVGLTRILEDLAESVAEDVSARRMVQAERARQTTTVRYVTLITVVFFGGFLLLGGAYVAPYGTALGQPILAVLLAAYVGVLVWLRKMNRAEPLPRLLEKVS
nr:type II secretion system F family protein [Tessaracoccus coleopterorum]